MRTLVALSIFVGLSLGGQFSCPFTLGQEDVGPVASSADAPTADRYGDPLPEGAIRRLGTLRLRHDQPAAATCFSPDGKLLATAGYEGARLWALDTAREVRSFVGSARRMTFTVAFSPDGTQLATTDEGRINIYDVASGNVVFHTSEQAGRITGIAFSPDGQTLATAAAQSVCLWDIASGLKLLDLKSNERGRDSFPVAFSPDGKLLAAATGRSNIQIWNVETGQNPVMIEKAHGDEVGSLVFSPDSRTLLSAGYSFEIGTREDGERIGIAKASITAWEPTTGQKQRSFTMDESTGPVVIALSRDGKTMASARWEHISLWNIESGKPQVSFPVAQNSFGFRPHSLAVSPDGSLLALPDAGSNAISVFRTDTQKPLFEFPDGHKRTVGAVAYSADGTRIATSDYHGEIQLWGSATGGHLRRIPFGASMVRTVVFTPDGRKLVAAGDTRNKYDFVGAVKIFDAKSGELLREIEDPCRAIVAAVSADGKYLAAAFANLPFANRSGGESNVSIWDLATGRPVARIPCQASHRCQLAFDPQGKSLWFAEGGAIKVWNASDGSEQHNLTLTDPGRSGFRSILFHLHENEAITVGGGESVIVWSLKSGQEARRFAVPENFTGTLALSPDRRMLATALFTSDRSRTQSAMFQVWNFRTGQCIGEYAADEGRYLSLAFSPDGRTLISGTERGTALVWDVNEAYQKLDP